MSELPRRLSPKTNLSSNWLNRLLDFLRSRDLRAGPGIKLTRTPSGTTVSFNGERAEGASCTAAPARVHSCSGGVYKVVVYPDANDYWHRRELTLPEVNSRAQLKTGTWVLAHPFKSPAAPIRQEASS